MTTVVAVNGSDISASVLFASASFTAIAGNGVGSCEFSVRDPGLVYAFTVGDEITLDVAGVRVWGGYITQAVRTFPLAVMPTTGSPLWQIRGADYNILFDKRVVRDLSNLNNTFTYAPGTHDDTIINDIFANYLDVSGDGLTTDIHRVAVAILDIPGVTTGRNTPNGGSAASQGFTWREVMYAIVRVTGAIYFISPSKVFTYVDVDTPSNSHVLSDAPQLVANGIGVNTLKVLDDATDMRNDALVWGAGIGSAKMVFSRKTDAPSVAAHNRWQYGDFNTGIYKQASADTIAAVYVDGSPSSKRGGKNPKVVYSATIFEPDVLVGDKVRCVSTVFGFDTTLPIRRVAIKTPTPDEAVFTLDCSFDIDAPWSIFDIYPWSIKLPTFQWPGSYPTGTSTGTSGGNGPGASSLLFDDFNRVVVRFPPPPGGTWGDTPASLAWSTRTPSSEGMWVGGPNSANPSNLFRGFSAGFVEEPGDIPGFPSTCATITSGPWQATSFVMVALVYLCGNGPGVGSTGDASPLAGTTTFEIGGNQGLQGYLGETPLPRAGVTLKHGIVSGGVITPYSAIEVHAGTGGTQLTDEVAVATYTALGDAPPPSAALGAYYVKWAYRVDGLLAQAKVWAVGDPEPGWQVSVDTSTYAGSPPTFNVFSAGGGPALPSGEWVSKVGVDSIAFDFPDPGSPTGYQCQDAIDIGDHRTFALAWPYLAGTTEVWLNGTRQRLGIDYAEVAGVAQVVFGSALVGTIAVRVCYVAAGGS